RRKVADRVAERAVIKKVDRFRGDRLDRGFDLFTRLDAGRIEAIGSGINESLQAANRLVEVGAVVDEALRARGEHDVAARFVDRVARGSYTLERKVEVVKRVAFIAGEIFNRQSGNAGVDA